MDNLGAFGPRPPAAPESKPASAPPVGAQPVAPVAAAQPHPEGKPLPPDEEQLALLIDQKSGEIDAKKGDHFLALGLERDAGASQVKAAFLKAAKIFHPDRLPPSLGHLSGKMTSVFEAVREAYEALFDDKKRADYLQSLTKASEKAALPKEKQAAADASDAFKKGELLMKKREFFAAEEQFQQAHRLEPKGLYLAAAGWAIYMDPARKAEAAKAKQLMVDALKLDRACDRAHYQLGILARIEGDMDRAERHFRDAVRANPKLLEANQELRLIDMRKKKTDKKGGLFR